MTARRRFAGLLMSACVLALLLPSAAHAAQQSFLRLDGIPGESRDVRHKDTIEVLSFAWGVSTTATATRPSFQSFSFTKRVDQASPLLLLRAAGGQVIPRATFSVRDTGNTQEYLVYCMTNVLVTELATSGSTGDDRPTEQVALTYGTIFQTYRRQNPDGTLSAPFVGGFDILRNVLLNASTC
jgi:type VI secretion system secreted protein Hcp